MAWPSGPLSSLRIIIHYDIGLLSDDGWTSQYNFRETVEYPIDDFP